MKRSSVGIEAVADWSNLVAAVERASRGKRYTPEAAAFLADLDRNLAALAAEILDGTVPVGSMTTFRIRDPKPRTIHAPCFRERVLHHAVIALVGPVLERAMVDDSFACRVGKGTLAAVRRTQEHVRRFAWYSKMDVRSYFADVDHEALKAMLRRRFRDARLTALLFRIVDGYRTAPGKGLPIGSLTSQWFANYYLNALDRFLLERRRVSGYVRYMDDFVIWDASRETMRDHVQATREFLRDRLALTLKEPPQTNRSERGVTICGYRVHSGTILLAQSRKRRFRLAVRRWEELYRHGRISATECQRGMDAALAIVAHAATQGWRRRIFAARPERLDL